MYTIQSREEKKKKRIDRNIAVCAMYKHWEQTKSLDVQLLTW